MGISNTQYRDIMFQYDQTRMNNQRILDKRYETLFAEIPVPFYLIISDCHASRHNPLLHTFTGNNEILAGTSSHEMGLCHPFIPAISIDR